MRTSLQSRQQSLAHAFLRALDGIGHALWTERNMRIHFAVAFIVLFWDLCVRPGLLEVTLTVVACCLVIAAELFNTGLERVVDLAADRQFRDLAKWAKDAAAGAVWMMCCAALAIAWYVAWVTPWRWQFFTLVHWPAAALSLFALLCLSTIVVWSVVGRKSYR
jgi:diacylglycerol kinase